MFGQKDDKDEDSAVHTDPLQAVNDGAAQLLASDPISSELSETGPPAVASATASPPLSDTWQHPGDPLQTASAVNPDTDHIKDVISPAGGYPSSANSRITTDNAAPFPPDEDKAADTAPALVSSDDVTDAELVDIKQKALGELVPLIDKLDQPPEEKFRTIMMMIQASDDQRLVEKAYESAHSIENEEARAQALLDIVNEINYFTQQPES